MGQELSEYIIKWQFPAIEIVNGTVRTWTFRRWDSLNFPFYGEPFHMWSPDRVKTYSLIRHKSQWPSPSIVFAFCVQNWWGHYSCRPHHFLCVQQRKHQNSIRQHNPKLKAFKFQFTFQTKCTHMRAGVAVRLPFVSWLVSQVRFIFCFRRNTPVHRHHCLSAPVRRSCSQSLSQLNNVAEMRVCVQRCRHVWSDDFSTLTKGVRREYAMVCAHNLWNIVRALDHMCLVCGENRFRFEMFLRLLANTRP